MSTNTQLFYNDEFGELRVLTIDDSPWFVGKDVTQKLEYSNSNKALSDHVDEEDKRCDIEVPDSLGRIRFPVCINESGLYALIMSSKMEGAKRFKHWVTSEILPSVRKYGGYMSDSLLEQIQHDPRSLLLFAKQLVEQKDHMTSMETRIKGLTPKAEYFDTFVNPNDCTNLRNTAKEIGVRQTELTSWLVRHKLLYRDAYDNLLPYATPKSRDFFILKDFYSHNGHHSVQTFVTPEGKESIRQMLLNDTVSEDIHQANLFDISGNSDAADSDCPDMMPEQS